MPKTKKKSNNQSNTRRILNYIAIVLLVVFLIFYISSWYKVKQYEKYGQSYLINSNTINLEISTWKELKPVFSEAPSDCFIFINYFNDEDTYKIEAGLKDIIDDYNLNNSFYYVNATKLMKEKDFYEKLNKELNAKGKIKNIPTLLYYKDGKLTKVICESNSKKTNTEFKNLLEEYEFIKK